MELYLLEELATDGTVQSLLRFRESSEPAAYYDAARKLLDFACGRALTDQGVREYLLRLLLDCPGLKQCFVTGRGTFPYLQRDIAAVWENLLAVDWDSLCERQGLLPLPTGPAEQRTDGTEAYRDWVEKLLDAPDPRALLACLNNFFGEYGDSAEARYTAFRWTGSGLEGISRPDPLTFDMLGGLEYQKRSLISNTRSFLDGLPANDVLLVGGSGTGKSSSVKATLNQFAGEGLRLVEVLKQDIATLPLLMRELEGKRCRYIIFIDDLSFESPDTSYIELKVALDGQMEKRPAHVLIYATSNRRRLIRESWNDRQGEDDVHENDTRHEKLSLSERFGIRLYFPPLIQSEYFVIVRLLLEQQGITWTDEIGKQAATWATQYNGRSGRTAKQFAADYSARLQSERSGNR